MIMCEKTEIPETRGGRIEKYPLSTLNVGDHFDWPIKENGILCQRRILAAARGRGIKIVTRTIAGILRVWRTA